MFFLCSALGSNCHWEDEQKTKTQKNNILERIHGPEKEISFDGFSKEKLISLCQNHLFLMKKMVFA